MISTSLEVKKKKKKKFRLIASFARSSPQPSLFYALKKICKKKKRIDRGSGEISVDRNTNRTCPYSFFFSLAILNNNNSILQLGNGEREKH
jgi:hypothetical protein